MVSAARRRIVFKAIRAAILKGNEIEYWTLRMYDQQAAGVLNDEQVAELEALIDAYYEALEASTDDPSIDDEPTDEPTEQTAETDAQ